MQFCTRQSRCRVAHDKGLTAYKCCQRAPLPCVHLVLKGVPSAVGFPHCALCVHLVLNKKKSVDGEMTAATPLPYALTKGTRQRPNLYCVPGEKYTTKTGSGLAQMASLPCASVIAHGKASIFCLFFIFSRIWYPNQYKQFIYIIIIIACISYITIMHYRQFF